MWAVRGKCKYYYRYKRVRGRLERTYIGTGAKAEQAAAEDAAVRAQREAGFAARRIAQANREPADASVVELSSLAELIVNSNLLLAGYHQHDQGEWRRKRRGGKKECSRAKTSTVTGPGEPSNQSVNNQLLYPVEINMTYEQLWRGKGIAAGATTIEELIQLIRASADELQAMADKGVTFSEINEPDYDFFFLETDDPAVAAEFGFEPEECDEDLLDYEALDDEDPHAFTIPATERSTLPDCQ